MGSRLFRLTPNKFVFHVISISLAAAVVLVFLGPVVEHHFVERQHNHSHIYLHTGLDGHWHPPSHPFETPHLHSDFGTHSGEHHAIMYQSSNDGIGDSNSFFVKTLISDLSTPIHRDGYYARRQANSESKLDETIVIPPERPHIT